MSHPISFSSIFKVHQYKEVAADSSDTVFLGEIPPNMYGFIERVGTSEFLELTYMNWEVDNMLAEKVERVIGFIDNPAVYNPPLLVKDKIRWIAYNNTDQSIVFEVLCDGLCYPKNYKFRR